MTTKPFQFWTVPGDSPQATKPVADHIIKLEAELAHLRSLLPLGLRVIDQTMADLRANLRAAREDAEQARKENETLRAFFGLDVAMHFGANKQRAQEAEAERDLLRAQLTKAVQERDAARAMLAALRS